LFVSNPLVLCVTSAPKQVGKHAKCQRIAFRERENMELQDIAKFRELNKELCSTSPYAKQTLYFMTKVYRTDKDRHMNPVIRKAHDAVRYAVRVGNIVKPKECQICGHERTLVGHHWHGYNYLLDVWWVCHPCNHKLPAHDGSITLEQAKVIYSDWRLSKFQSPSTE